tara:strand:+ start:704 stop:913 length:210 start_codon:yes stop_codon:yes gene_type:complete
MNDKLKSRKFWMALVGAILPIVAAALSQEMPYNEAVMESIAVIMAYIFGQGYVDGKSIEASKPIVEAAE